MKSNFIQSFWALLKHSFFIGSICGLLYFIGLYLVHIAGQSYSAMPDWLYRLVLLLGIMWAVLTYRIKNRNSIGFGKGFAVAMLTSVIMGLYMGAAVGVVRGFVIPEYHMEAQKIYRANRSNQMYHHYKTSENKEQLTAQDSVLIESGLEKHLVQTEYYFTNSAAILINIIYSILWGLGIGLTVAYLAMKKN